MWVFFFFLFRGVIARRYRIVYFLRAEYVVNESHGMIEEDKEDSVNSEKKGYC